MHSQHQSPFFRLSGELRNHIYELCYISTITSSESVNILDIHLSTSVPKTAGAPSPPSTALIRSCQRLHSELAKLHYDAASAFWGQPFTLTIDIETPDCSIFSMPKDAAFKHLSDLEFIVDCEASLERSSVTLRNGSTDETRQGALSIRNTTGILKREHAAKMALVCGLSFWQSCEPRISRREIYERVYEAIVQAVVDYERRWGAGGLS